MRIAKAVLFLLGLLPFLALVWGIFHDALGANPVEHITHETGDWALRFLLVTLSITPLRRVSGWLTLVHLRRMLGLYAFFYASLHFLAWLWLDQDFAWGLLLEDVLKRPYITVGFTAFVLLIPLALTSNRYAIRRLGKRWKTLHQLVYPIVLLGVLHYLWLVKADLLEPLIYGLILVLLLIARVIRLPAWRPKNQVRTQ